MKWKKFEMSLTLTRKQALSMLEKVGANIIPGAEHLKAKLVIDGKHVFLIPISNGSKDIPTGTAQKIFRATGLLERKDCENLRNCPMTADEYIRIIRKRGFI